MNVDSKMDELVRIVNEIKEVNPVVGGVLIEGFSLSISLLQELAERGERKQIDVSEHLQVIERVLGFSLQDIVTHIMMNQQGEESQKAPDADTLNFITAGMDDYEKFLAQNKAKDDLEFLSKSI